LTDTTKKPAETGAAPRPETAVPANAYLAAVLGWLLPGSGHFLLGRVQRGAFYLAVVASCVGIGLALHGNLYRVIGGQPLTVLATLGSMGLGLPYFVLRLGLGYEGVATAASYEYGTAFLLTAGVMNLLLVIDAWDIALGRKN
jgi:hypothetical protein